MARAAADQVLVVRDWHNRYENNRSRELENPQWFPCPNRYDTESFIELMSDHPQGPAHYAVWIVILGIASRSDARGVLCRSRGAHTCDSVARIAHVDSATVATAIARLLEIEWLEQIPLSQAQAQMASEVGKRRKRRKEKAATSSQKGAAKAREEEKEEEEERKGPARKEDEDDTADESQGAVPAVSLTRSSSSSSQVAQDCRQWDAEAWRTWWVDEQAPAWQGPADGVVGALDPEWVRRFADCAAKYHRDNHGRDFAADLVRATISGGQWINRPCRKPGWISKYENAKRILVDLPPDPRPVAPDATEQPDAELDPDQIFADRRTA